jgi:DNA-binding PucR family transcriptional regulator
MVNATQHIPDDSDTTAEAMTAVMEALPCRTAEESNESVLDENAEFATSRLNHHESDVRAEWTEAMSELVQRANAIDVVCSLQNLKDVFSETELAGIRAFSLKGAGNTTFTAPAEFMTRHLIPLMILNKTLADTLLSSSPKSGEVSPEWDSVNASSLLTSTFGDLRMRTWTQDSLGPHPKDDGSLVLMATLTRMMLQKLQGGLRKGSVQRPKWPT